MNELLKSNGSKNNHRARYCAEFKRRVVEDSLASGASVRKIAKQNAISISVLYKWRHDHFTGHGNPGRLGPVHPGRNTPVSCGESAGLLPIDVVDAPLLKSATLPDHQTNKDQCVVEFDRARLCLRSDVSPSMLRVLIEELLR